LAAPNRSLACVGFARGVHRLQWVPSHSGPERKSRNLVPRRCGRTAGSPDDRVMWLPPARGIGNSLSARSAIMEHLASLSVSMEQNESSGLHGGSGSQHPALAPKQARLGAPPRPSTTPTGADTRPAGSAVPGCERAEGAERPGAQPDESTLADWPFIRREAVLPSRIQGTQASLSDLCAHQAVQLPLFDRPANLLGTRSKGSSRVIQPPR
jgi:hypothetical protein